MKEPHFGPSSTTSNGTAPRNGCGENLGDSRELKDALSLVRALLTVRDPAPLPDIVNAAIDALLARERSSQTLTDVATLPRFALPGTAPSFALWQGDITTVKADAIVNAANKHLLGCFQPFHACIDNAIHWAAGPRLRADCDRIMHAQKGLEPTGLAKVTRGYDLPSRYVLHTVGPIVEGSLTQRHRTDLGRCYRACLDLAALVGDVRSVVFCGISTGVFGFPRAAAARIALETVRAWVNEHPRTLEVIVFNVFGEEDKAAYVDALAEATR